MKTPGRAWVAGIAVLALAAWTLSGGAAPRKKKDAKPDILKLADLIEKGKDADAKKLAKAIADKFDDLEIVMKVLKPRGKKKVGLGVGTKPNAIQPDGIEQKLLAIGRDPLTQRQFDKEAAALSKLGYHTAAVAAVAAHKGPASDKGKATKKAWLEWNKDMHTEALNFAKAAKAKDLAAVNATAKKLNASCASCHAVFRKNN
jgi:cytochrome c556